MTSEPPGPPARKKNPTPIVVAVVGLGLLGVAASLFLSYPQGSVTGEIVASGDPHGTFVVHPVTCYSGSHWGFSGLWLVTEMQTSGNKRGFTGGLKIVEGDDGSIEAHVENPLVCTGFKCQQRRVDPAHCKLFEVAIGERNWWFRRAGHARFECRFPEGGELKADLTFRSCGQVPSSGGDP
jgi:hypothetical protein